MITFFKKTAAKIRFLSLHPIKSYFCRFIIIKYKNIKKMKKIIALAILFIGSVLIFSACDTQKRCAAYGHYSYNMPAENPDNID